MIIPHPYPVHIFMLKIHNFYNYKQINNFLALKQGRI